MGMSPVLVMWYLECEALERIPALVPGCDAIVRYLGDMIELLEAL
jgi:hypothetical protein